MNKLCAYGETLGSLTVVTELSSFIAKLGLLTDGHKMVVLFHCKLSITDRPTQNGCIVSL